MSWMAPIMARGPLWSDDGLDYTIHGLSVHIHLLRCQPALTVEENRQPVPIHRLLISPPTGAANARASKVVRVNVSPDFGDVTHWKKERTGRGKQR